MEATDIELDHLCATRTAGPAFILAQVEDMLGALVLAADVRPAIVPAPTPGARACRAPWCGAVVDGRTATKQGALGDRAEKVAARRLDAIYAVEGAEFSCLLFESRDEVAREMGLGLCESDVLAAAAGRIKTLITCSGLEEVGKAGDVVVMAAWRANFGPVDRVLADDADMTCCSSGRISL